MKKNSLTAPSLKRVFIVEDHLTFRECLVEIVNDEDDMVVCGEAGEAGEALRAIAELKPDLALVDLKLPGKSGLELIKEIRSVNPGIKLLVVSMHEEAQYAQWMLREGANGYIMKQEDPEQIIHAMRDVLGGHIYLSESMLR